MIYNLKTRMIESRRKFRAGVPAGFWCYYTGERKGGFPVGTYIPIREVSYNGTVSASDVMPAGWRAASLPWHGGVGGTQ
tara:strand:- start:26 stop:262 length:237 start_codon:yes stop_codon:yes gene_type:complete